ncbi:MAG: flagellar hook capping FlgD N-terminal domain-containing protein [Acetobacteraceae bacterium]|nr:flagellar hook capping FlgD N-terminal domain-containing protein [Acetobacteraceae bacterium]
MTVSATTAAGSAAASTTKTAASNSALGSLSGNLNSFLTLLMTQLQNQDPTSPMDTNAFTSQLVQYASVEQQINTNSNLTNLITATQSNTVLQSSSLIGKQITVTNDHLTLQNGSSLLHFSASSAEPVTVTITSASGQKILQTNVSAASGNNDWSWNGQDSDGNRVPDGAYQVMVSDRSGTGIPTTITGTVTGMQRSGTTVNAVMGSLQSDVGTIQSVVTPNS